MAALLVDRPPILVAVRRFPSMGIGDSRSLRFDNYVRMQHFVRRNTFVPFRRFCVDVRREFMQVCNVFRLRVMVIWVPISATLCKRAMLMSWHAFLFLGLSFFLFSSFGLVVSAA
jgi:hypothetical protein